MNKLISFLSCNPNQHFRIKNTQFVFNECALRTTRMTALVFLGLGVINYTFPKLITFTATQWANPVAMGVTVVALALLLGSQFLIKKINENEACILKNRFSEGHTLVSIENESPEIVELLDELCQNNCHDNSRNCSLERAREIIERLRKLNKLSLLNAIPKCVPISAFPNDDTIFYTPLHDWAREGNLDIVKLLIGAGAKDYFSYISDNASLWKINCMKNALYAAALRGDAEIVKYLIKNGSSADTIFLRKHVFLSLIPTLVHEIVTYRLFDAGVLESFTIILNHLQDKNPNNLKFQLKTPICDQFNSLDWLISKRRYFLEDTIQKQGLEKIIKALKDFGAKEQDIFSVEDCKMLPNDVCKKEVTFRSGLK